MDTTNFERNWKDYAEGFGDPNGSFWLGLDNIHVHTASGLSSLLIELEAYDGDTAYALYDNFTVADSSDKYRLHISSYHGTAGEQLIYNNNMQFTTSDSDNDLATDKNCASAYLMSGWWYTACSQCNLNGIYEPNLTATRSASYRSFKGNTSLKKIEMILFDKNVLINQ